jgi:2-polyprenyl-6-methoxyphenol hydroxylase-like FAD-dependent oxidoreductase
MAEIVIVGAGIGGLGAALILGRQGRRVVVCERDPAPVPRSADEMWSAWPRPGTPQARLGHGFYPGFRRLLQEHAPDVLQRLWDTGAPPLDWPTRMPGDERRPEDAELTGLMCRRPVLEGIVRQAVEAEPTVELRAGCPVAGLLAASSLLDGIPRMVGVRTKDHGDIAADSVVVAGGRRLPIQRWLEEIGAPPPAEEAEGCGFQWYARHFRLRAPTSEDHRGITQLTTAGDLRWMKYFIWGTDQDTFFVELGVPIWEDELHALRQEALFMAVARAMPEGATWLDPERCTPIGPVATMGQEHNRLRRFTHEGHPLAVGLHVIGDARCQTNSIYGWGVGLAFAEAVVLADVLAEWPGDAVAQTAAFEARMGEEIAGRHRLSVVLDRACLRTYRGEPAWDVVDSGAGFIEAVVVPAASEDAEVFRAVMRRLFQLDPVAALAGNAAVHERARHIAVTRPPTPPPGPTREEVLQIIAAARP